MRPEERHHLKVLLGEAKKTDIPLPPHSAISPEEREAAHRGLSDAERRQLGQPVGKESSYISAAEWPRVRSYMTTKSQYANPNLDPELTAYTPGETVKLLQHKTIVAWHDSMARFVIPKGYDTVVLVPCAKTKPWEGPKCNPSLYAEYNQLRQRYGNLYFVTISEPLGVVPQQHWSDFPQYDNPGLFKDPPQRSDMHTKQWKEFYPGIPSRLQTPFDIEAYNKAIEILAGVIKQFIATNKSAYPGLRFISFADDPKGRDQGSHSHMLDKAEFSGSREEKAQKRGASKGREPMAYLTDKLSAAGVIKV